MEITKGISSFFRETNVYAFWLNAFYSPDPVSLPCSGDSPTDNVLSDPLLYPAIIFCPDS